MAAATAPVTNPPRPIPPCSIFRTSPTFSTLTSLRPFPFLPSLVPLL